MRFARRFGSVLIWQIRTVPPLPCKRVARAFLDREPLRCKLTPEYSWLLLGLVAGLLNPVDYLQRACCHGALWIEP